MLSIARAFTRARLKIFLIGSLIDFENFLFERILICLRTTKVFITIDSRKNMKKWWFFRNLKNMMLNIPRFRYRSPPPYSPPPSFLRFWNRSKTLTRLEEEFETSDVFRVIYSNNWNLFSSQFIVKYLLSSFPFWITAKMQYDWRKVVELSNKFEER